MPTDTPPAAPEIARRIAEAYYPPLPEVAERNLATERYKAQDRLIDVATPILAPLVQRADSAERERPKWISVDERKPSPNECAVLIAYWSNIDGIREICEAEWDGESFLVSGERMDFEQQNATHWMRLPAAPSGETGGGKA